MGKQFFENQRNLQGRLSLDRSNGVAKGYDARFKLNKRASLGSGVPGNKIRRALTQDARELLQNRQQQQQQQQANVSTSFKPRNRASTDPVVIVTGLSNVRKDGGKLRVVGRPPPPGKTVISDGRNTLVTLQNTNALTASNKNNKMRYRENDNTNDVGVDDDITSESIADLSNQHVARRDGKFNNHDKEFKAIKVMFDNDRVNSSSASSSSGQNFLSSASSSRRPTSPSPSHFRRDEEVDIGGYSSREQSRRGTHSPHRIPHNTPYSSLPTSSALVSSYAKSKQQQQQQHHRAVDEREMMDYEEEEEEAPKQSRSSNGHHHHHHHHHDNDRNHYHERHNSSSGNSSSSSGYKLIVTNLHPRVTEDDVLELFSDIGPIKRAYFVDKGVAEVVYVKLEHAREAIHKYDRSELDGRQMRIELVGSSGVVSSSSSSHQISSSQSSSSSSYSKKTETNGSKNTNRERERERDRERDRDHRDRDNYKRTTNESTTTTTTTTLPLNSLSTRFKTLQRNDESPSIQLPESSKSNSRIHVDSSIIHSVLFKKTANEKEDSPVTFTVKL